MQRSQPFCGEGDEAIQKGALRNTGTARFFNHQQFTRCDAVCCLVGVPFPLGLVNELKAFEHSNCSDTKVHSLLLQYEIIDSEILDVKVRSDVWIHVCSQQQRLAVLFCYRKL